MLLDVRYISSITSYVFEKQNWTIPGCAGLPETSVAVAYEEAIP